MDIVGLFVPMAAFMMLTVMIGLVTRLIATAMLNKTIREAMRSDPGSVPLLTERLEARQPWTDALLGWIFIALAVAMLLLGLTEDDPEDRHQILRGVIVPVVVGATVLFYTWYAGRQARQGNAG